jgi:hypothetical protein
LAADRDDAPVRGSAVDGSLELGLRHLRAALDPLLASLVPELVIGSAPGAAVGPEPAAARGRDVVDRCPAGRLRLADRRGVMGETWRTTDWTYLRFHEGRARPRPTYGRAALAAWADRLAAGWSPDEDCYVYFNNDHRAAAPRDAARFARLVARTGLRPSRVPSVRSIKVATERG